MKTYTWILWAVVLATSAFGQGYEWKAGRLRIIAEVEECCDMAEAHAHWNNAAGTGNWGTAGNWVGSQLPDATHGAFFDDTSQADVLLGLNQTAVHVPFVHRGADYHGNIGAVGNPLIISTSLLRIESDGFINFQNGDTSTADVVVDATNQGNAALLDGDIRRLWVLKGEATTGTGYGENNISVYVGTRGGIEDAILTIGTLHSGLALVIQKAGIINYNDQAKTHGDLQLSGGHFILDANNAFNGDIYMTGGSFTGKGLVSIGGFHLLGGAAYFDVDGATKTIQQLYRMPGTTLVENNNMVYAADRVPDIPLEQ